MSSTEVGRRQQRDATKAKELYNTIRLEIERSLIVVSKMLHYGSGAGAIFGFYCPKCPYSINSIPAICDEDEPIVMRCKKCGPIDLDDRNHLWFGEKMVATIICQNHLHMHSCSTMQIFDSREDVLMVTSANQIHSSNDCSSCSTTIQTQIL